MENEEKMMTGEESLRIITEMINKTKVNIRQGIFHLLFWGWLIFAISLAEYLLLKFTDFKHPYYVWMLVIPGVFVSMIYGFVNGRKAKVHTYADMIYMWTWLGFIIAATVLFIVHAKSMETVASYIMLLAGFPTFVSGFILKFRPLIAGGICFWIFALVVHFAGPSLAPLGVPVAMLTGYLIPGYLLKNKVDHDKV
ncbi:MAG: hypothetical protein NTX93_12000 [Bacteroidia bacterium]|nr:hypothetical protein [Bacteroidia bacterium]